MISETIENFILKEIEIKTDLEFSAENIDIKNISNYLIRSIFCKVSDNDKVILSKIKALLSPIKGEGRVIIFTPKYTGSQSGIKPNYKAYFTKPILVNNDVLLIDCEMFLADTDVAKKGDMILSLTYKK